MNSGSYTTKLLAIVNKDDLVLSFEFLKSGWQIKEPLIALMNPSWNDGKKTDIKKCKQKWVDIEINI